MTRARVLQLSERPRIRHAADAWLRGFVVGAATGALGVLGGFVAAYLTGMHP